MFNETKLPYHTFDDFPHLEVISIEGRILESSDSFKKSTVEAWSLQDICYDTESSERMAETLAEGMNKECWVIDRSHGNLVTFRFAPAGGLTLP